MHLWMSKCQLVQHGKLQVTLCEQLRLIELMGQRKFAAEGS